MIVCSSCRANITKDSKSFPECGGENLGDAQKRCKSQMGSDAQAIIDAVNVNTDSKFDSLRKDIQGLGLAVSEPRPSRESVPSASILAQSPGNE